MSLPGQPHPPKFRMLAKPADRRPVGSRRTPPEIKKSAVRKIGPARFLFWATFLIKPLLQTSLFGPLVGDPPTSVICSHNLTKS